MASIKIDMHAQIQRRGGGGGGDRGTGGLDPPMKIFGADIWPQYQALENPWFVTHSFLYIICQTSTIELPSSFLCDSVQGCR